MVIEEAGTSARTLNGRITVHSLNDEGRWGGVSTHSDRISPGRGRQLGASAPLRAAH